MYSKERAHVKDKALSNGVFILGKQGGRYFIQTGNTVTANSAAILKKRIDYLNTLDKSELRRYFKKRILTEDDNPESMGAGLGLIEIARRAASKIDYEMSPEERGHHYFSIFVMI
jgi:hypothetical protein